MTVTESDSFALLSVDQVLDLPAPDSLVEGMISSGGLSMLYGPPGVGKTFMGLDLSLSIATGQSCLGRATIQGSVVYIAAEGSGGLPNRLGAWFDSKEIARDTASNIPCKFLPEPVNLLNDKTGWPGFVKQIEQAHSDLRLVVIDTLARCSGGAEENSAKDMGTIIDSLGLLQRQTGASVLLIHHSGKDKNRGARGSSALLGAADTVIEMSRDGSGFKMNCEKQKDAEKFEEIRATLKPVDLGEGKSSCVVELRQESGSSELDEKARTMLDVLENQLARSATATKWQKACEEKGVTRETFYKRRPILLAGKRVWKCGEGQGASYTFIDQN